MKTYADKKDLNNIIKAIILAAATMIVPWLIMFVIKFADIIDKYPNK